MNYGHITKQLMKVLKNGIIEFKLDDVSKSQFAKALSEYLILERQYVRKIKLMNSIRNYKK